MKSARRGPIAATALIADPVIGLARRGFDLVCHKCCRVYATAGWESNTSISSRLRQAVIAIKRALMRPDGPGSPGELVG